MMTSAVMEYSGTSGVMIFLTDSMNEVMPAYRMMATMTMADRYS